jgi:hypothetical protein
MNLLAVAGHSLSAPGRVMHSSVRFCSLTFAALALGLFAAMAFAQTTTTTYTYDELGRLRQASMSGSQTGSQSYTYDAAGNRTQTQSSAAPTVPASINVPNTSGTGVYTVQWGTSQGTVTAYELYEASNSSFSGQVNRYSGVALSKGFTGKATGTYFYRVRACNTSADCSGYRAAANSIVVTVTPSQPPSISVPNSTTNTTGSYTISWAASTSGVVTAYELYEATNASFTVQVIAYSGLSTSKLISGKLDGAYYYRVRACNTATDCSVYRSSGTPVTVLRPPSAPVSISVPSSSSTGVYSISWGASPSGTVTHYELFEATNSSFTGQTAIAVSASPQAIVRATGTYYYRIRACNTSASCSGYAPGPNVITVTLPPGMPTVPQNLRKSPTTGTTSTYTILWDASAGPVSYYILEQSVGGAFTPFPQINHPTTSKSFNQSCGEYTYRVKACSSGGTCSGYSNSTTKRVCNSLVP